MSFVRQPSWLDHDSYCLLAGVAVRSSRFRIGPVRILVVEEPAPDAPSVSHGPRTGTLQAVISPVTGGYAYNWRLALASAPTVYVQTAQTTGVRNMFEGLTPGQIYNIEANAVGAAGVGDWSDVGGLMVI